MSIHFCSFTKGVANEAQPGVLWRICTICGRTEGRPNPDYVAPKTITLDEFISSIKDCPEKYLSATDEEILA